MTVLAGCDPTGGDATCVSAFVSAFGGRAWRRPLTADELAAILQLYTDTADPGPTDGLAGVVATMLQAPQFLYRPEPATATATTAQPVDGYALATRLAYLLTGAGPDATLLAAAGNGDLATEAGLLAQTDRLLDDARAADLFVHFASEWWEIEALATLEKDEALYPAWTDGTPAALGEETTDFLVDAWQSGPTLTALLTAPVTFADAPLAAYYGLPAPSGDGYQRIALDPTRAAGMLTQGSFLAVHAKADQTSPVQRGKFVRAQLFCTPPPPPPPSIVVAPPVVDPAPAHPPAVRAAHRRPGVRGLSHADGSDWVRLRARRSHRALARHRRRRPRRRHRRADRHRRRRRARRRAQLGGAAGAERGGRHLRRHAMVPLCLRPQRADQR